MPQQTDARDRYLSIAAEMFAQQGFHGASLAAIAGRAGVTKQALLHFYGSKERLYSEVLAALADRLTAGIDALDAPDAETRLIAYFDAHAAGDLTRPGDARLVVRALLDSDPAAKQWPLKPYLDKLVDLALMTRRWRGAERMEVLAGLYHLIGAIQYAAISGPTIKGMFGAAPQSALRAHVAQRIAAEIRAFVAPV